MSEPIRRALISVSDKSSLTEIGTCLKDHGVEILSTGGTARVLRESGFSVVDVSEHTGFPEIMDGRVKTLHPKIHGGLLARRNNDEDLAAMDAHGIDGIDLLIVNLYPFEVTVAAGADEPECIENIDIGGPGMIRAAAKNYASVTVIVDHGDYHRLISEMDANDGCTTPEFRRILAAKAYRLTGAYDTAIGNWFASVMDEEYPEQVLFSGRLKQTLRYGENPHQSAAVYKTGPARPGVVSALQLQGKELSFNNLNDTDAAFELVAEFEDTACAIIKHANPCGVATGGTLAKAYERALVCDTESAFGGIVAVNRTLDVATAEEITKLYAEVVIAPEVEVEARTVLAGKNNLRVLEAGGMPATHEAGMTVRSLAGGLLLQGRDSAVTGEVLKVVSKRTPTDAEMADLKFAFTVCKHVKSNAIIYVKDCATVGIGAGQMSRINSSRIAAWKAKDASFAAGEAQSRAIGSVVASDAFFPFADGLIEAAEAGVTAVIQPGGSIRDDEVIAAADERNLAMVFTGMRHFRH